MVSLRVTFSDIMKLRAAYSTFDALVTSGSYGGYTTTAWSDFSDSPVGGWNICSRDKSEYGFLENVCLFGGDVFIDGLVRTELSR